MSVVIKMPRKRRNSNSAPEDYDVLAKKIRKIERKLMRARRKQRTPSPRDYSPRSNADSSPEHEDIQDNLDEIVAGPSSASLPPATLEENPVVSETLKPADQHIEPAQTMELDDEVLEILGDDPTLPKVKSKDIQPALAVRLEHIATSGLSTELRKEIFNRYTLPSNCALIGAPILNPEVKAAVSETVLKRDQSMEAKQKQLGTAISCLTEAITPLLLSGKDPNQLRLLMDSARMLCDVQYKQSANRRNLLLYNLKKELKDQMKGAKIDNFLFGNGLADSLKAAKAISRSGTELKQKTALPAPARKSGPNFQTNRTYPSTSQNLNWKAPPPGRRQTGTQRRKEPAALRSRPERSSKRSSQVDRGRSRR